MNHCCDPNTDCDWGESDVGKYLVLATKPIRVGDELTCVTTCFKKVFPTILPLTSVAKQSLTDSCQVSLIITAFVSLDSRSGATIRRLTTTRPRPITAPCSSARAERPTAAARSSELLLAACTCHSACNAGNIRLAQAWALFCVRRPSLVQCLCRHYTLTCCQLSESLTIAFCVFDYIVNLVEPCTVPAIKWKKNKFILSLGL